jgi:hypothetical protein
MGVLFTNWSARLTFFGTSTRAHESGKICDVAHLGHLLKRWKFFCTMLMEVSNQLSSALSVLNVWTEAHFEDKKRERCRFQRHTSLFVWRIAASNGLIDLASTRFLQSTGNSGGPLSPSAASSTDRSGLPRSNTGNDNSVHLPTAQVRSARPSVLRPPSKSTVVAWVLLPLPAP